VKRRSDRAWPGDRDPELADDPHAPTEPLPHVHARAREKSLKNFPPTATSDLSALAPSFSRRANVAMMPAHVARFAPDATAQVGMSCLGYKAHFSEVTEPRAIATVAPAASWCGEITQENLSQNAQIRRRRKRI
jgi:hypothetical protein